jgi:hypothetical protein
MGEVLLNLSKVLEVLFPGPEGHTIDAAREGLAKLNYTEDDIAKWYIPAIALRNGLDVAHVSLVSFNQEQLRAVHAYTAQAEDHFRKLLLRVIDGVTRGAFSIPQYNPQSSDAERIIQRLSEQFPE